MDKDLIKQAMSELGKESAKARKEKLGTDYMRVTQVKGVGARQKKAGFEMATHKNGSETIEHKKGWNCGLQNCSEKTIKTDGTVKKDKKITPNKKGDMLYEP